MKLRLLLALLILPIWTLQLSLPAGAVSEHVLIYQVQTGGSGSGAATEEFVLLLNTADVPVELTNWCIEYASAADNVGFNVCLASDPSVELWVEAGGLVSFSTSSFNIANNDFVPDVVIVGGLAANGGHIRIVNGDDQEIDKLGWGTASNPEGSAAAIHTNGEVLSRDPQNVVDTDDNAIDFSSQPIIEEFISGVFEVERVIDVCANIPDVQQEPPATFLVDEAGNCFQDVCANVDGLQKTVPAGYVSNEAFNCEEVPLEDSVLFITELRPNAPSVDEGQEFIELFNPHNKTILLSGYKLQLGPSFTKEYVFIDGEITANQYVTISDTESGIVLPNSSGQQLRLIAPAGNTVSESAVYENADDDVSWALVEDQWIFTNQITPGSANLPFLEDPVDEVAGVTSVLGPCPAGKFRNPETNRCKNIESSVSQLIPCDEDEYRNPETNRCKKLESASSLAPCPEGQERNSETNRCRRIAVLASNDNVPTVQDIAVVQTPGSINWPIILFAVGGTLAYMIYEWRHELRRKYANLKSELSTRFSN